MKGTEYKGEFISKTDNSISFKAVGMLNAQKIHIKTIERLILADGTVVIDYGYFIEEGESLKDRKKISLSTIGGSLIGLSGVLMYSTNQETIDLDATVEEQKEFIDKQKSNFDLSYLLLTLGAF